MKSFQTLVAILAALLMINTSMVAGSSSTEVVDKKVSQLEQIQVDSEERKLFFGIKPHPKPKGGGSSSDSSGSGGSSSGGSSGGSSSGGSSGGSSSGGSSSGGSSGSSGGSSGSSSGSSSSSSASAANSSGILAQQGAKKNLAIMLSFAAVAGLAIAAIAIPRRKVATENDHALKGILNKRIGLFSNLAKHASSRPPRRDEDGRYINADAIV